MVKEKQIEEMAKELQKDCEQRQEKDCFATPCSKCRAEYLYNAGYRKQSEVAREIFAEVEEIIRDRKLKELKRQGDNKMISPFTYSLGALEIIECQFAELKKKYTETCTDCGHFVGCEKAVWTGPCEAFTETESTKTEEGVNENGNT